MVLEGETSLAHGANTGASPRSRFSMRVGRSPAGPSRTPRNMPYLTRTLRQAALAMGLTTMACASRTETPQGGAPAETVRPVEPAAHQHDMAALPASPGHDYTVADVRFMQNMIGHHAQAIVMAGMAPKHRASEIVLRLAQKIDISQRDEIVFMKAWLMERKQAVPTDEQSHTMMMPGMLTPEMMTQLGKANGREFDRLFLTFMIGHHEGALQMVKELFASPMSAQESDIFRFATDVEVDQRDEIFVMNKMLDILREESR
jgi:uncharacterized protein (DUF305 family)